MKKWAFLLAALAFFGCETTTTEELIIEPEELFITSLQKEVVADQAGGTSRVEVTSNCEWKVSSAPKWASVEKITEGGKAYIEVTITPNDADTPREGAVWLTFKRATTSVSVMQSGKDKELSLMWYSFPVNYFSDASFELQADKVTRKYRLTGKGVFINPSIKSTIFPGNEIDRHTDNILQWKSYATDFPTTISTMTGGKFYSKELPKASLEGLNELAREVIAALPQQSLSFSYQNTPMYYTTYRNLHLLGMGNLGLGLDEMVSGKSYKEQEMTKHTGLIYSYSNKIFDVIMDYPPASAVSKNTNTAYIAGIGYGKTALLLIETDHDYTTAKNVVNKIIQKASLTAGETQISSELDVYYLYFESDSTPKLVKGRTELIGRFTSEISTLPIIPLNFVVLNASQGFSQGEVTVGLELQ